MSDDGLVTSVIPPGARLVMAHGAGSCADFLRAAFPPEVVEVAEVVALEDRTGDLSHVMNALAAAAKPDRPTVIGGVSLGAHAAATLLARDDVPDHVVGGLFVMPAWTGTDSATADMTAAAAEALRVLGPTGVLAELDPDDWVTPLLRHAWRLRTQDRLVAELDAAARSAGPTVAQLEAVAVPVAVVALRDDPLHPLAVAHQWQSVIPRAELAVLDRAQPGSDLTAFAAAAAAAWHRLGARIDLA